jgi:hypothetical protein
MVLKGGTIVPLLGTQLERKDGQVTSNMVIERPICTLKPGSKFTLLLDGWGRHYGHREGTVLAHGVGSTLVRWDGEPIERTFETRHGVMATFTFDRKEYAHICLATPVIEREQ